MNRVSLIVVVLIAAPVITYGQAQNSKPRSTVEQQLIRLENDWLRADARRDKAALKRLVADDWTFTTSRGEVKNRAQMLNDLRPPEPGDTVSTISGLRVRVYGKTAIVTGLLTEKGPVVTITDKGRVLGEELTTEKRFTDVWVKNNVGWQCVATHYSPVHPTRPQ